MVFPPPPMPPWNEISANSWKLSYALGVEVVATVSSHSLWPIEIRVTVHGKTLPPRATQTWHLIEATTEAALRGAIDRSLSGLDA